MNNVEGGEMRALSALRGPFLDSRRTLTFSFASSATVPAWLDLTLEGVLWPARRLVRPPHAQKNNAKAAKRRQVHARFRT